MSSVSCPEVVLAFSDWSIASSGYEPHALLSRMNKDVADRLPTEWSETGNYDEYMMSLEINLGEAFKPFLKKCMR